jgi:thioredoxin reductase
LHSRPAHELYAVVVIGTGPAGLTPPSTRRRKAWDPRARRHQRADRELPGLPQRVSGAELAGGAHRQALRFGAELLVRIEIARRDRIRTAASRWSPAAAGACAAAAA